MVAALAPLIAFIVKIVLYYVALKVRKLQASFITCAMCAGASVLVELIPFPLLLQFALTITIAGFFIVKNADADMFPDGVFIPFVVEVVAAFALSYVVLPLVEML